MCARPGVDMNGAEWRVGRQLYTRAGSWGYSLLTDRRREGWNEVEGKVEEDLRERIVVKEL